MGRPVSRPPGALPTLRDRLARVARQHAAALSLVAFTLLIVGPAAALALAREDNGPLTEARAQAEASNAKLTAAQQQLIHLNTVREAGAAQTQLREQAEQRLAAAQGNVTSLTTQLKAAEAKATADAAAIAAIRKRVEVLTQCLDGTEVALQFSRRGNDQAADRALVAVKDACAQVNAGG